MSILEATALDMSAIILQAYELGDSINDSSDVADFLYWKNLFETDLEVKQLLVALAKKKELFEECQRFGHFHPDYHSALGQLEHFQQQMDQNEIVRRYKLAEENLDDLLYNVSRTIAYAVSESIKVPGNNPLEGSDCSTGGCSTGGGCSGKCS